MVADQFLSYVQKWSLGRTANLNDYSDKYHYMLMTIFLILFATLTTLRQYVFQPIVCEVADPPGSSNNFGDYINNLCWVEGTYTDLGPETSGRLKLEDEFWKRQRKAVYYQWIPFTLALQAALFFLPRLLWLAYVHNREGPDLEALLDSAAEANKASNWLVRRNLIEGIGGNIDFMLRLRQPVGAKDGYISRRRPWRRCLSQRPRGCLPLSYGTLKALFLANALLQMYAMGVQLAPESSAPFLFGFRLITALRNGSDWHATRLFPRVTLCRVTMLHVGVKNNYVAQCILPLNMLNEKIYCFLWVATAVGAGLTCLSLAQWALRLLCGRGRWRHHLRRYLFLQQREGSKDGAASIALQNSHDDQQQLVYDFAEHLHTDGVFLLHMLRLNVGEIVACDVTNELYRLWLQRRPEEPPGSEEEKEKRAVDLEAGDSPPYPLLPWGGKGVKD